MRRGAPVLLVLYLAWVVAPSLHQIHRHLGQRAGSCQPCPVEDPGWRIFSHLPDQPCSDPDHHHHPRPVHDEDHCLACRLSGAAVVALPSPGVPIVSIQRRRCLVPQPLLAPFPPELLALLPRAPPLLGSA